MLLLPLVLPVADIQVLHCRPASQVYHRRHVRLVTDRNVSLCAEVSVVTITAVLVVVSCTIPRAGMLETLPAVLLAGAVKPLLVPILALCIGDAGTRQSSALYHDAPSVGDGAQ